MGSGLLYAGLLVVWALVLVQYLVRHHDDADESGALDGRAAGVRVLARRTRRSQEPSAASEVAARRRAWAAESARTGAVDTTVPDPAQPEVVEPVGARRVRAARARLAARRRRVLLCLVVLTAALGGVAAASLVPLWAVAPAGVLTVGYLVHLRVQARRATRIERRRRAARRRQQARMAASTGAAAPVRTAAAEPVAARAAGPRAAGVRAGEPAAATTVPGEWDPIPVPLPTYVTKPKAVRTARSIDLTGSGPWSSGGLTTGPVLPSSTGLGPAAGAAAGNGPADAMGDGAPGRGVADGDVVHDGVAVPDEAEVEHRRAVND